MGWQLARQPAVHSAQTRRSYVRRQLVWWAPLTGHGFAAAGRLGSS